MPPSLRPRASFIALPLFPPLTIPPPSPGSPASRNFFPEAPPSSVFQELSELKALIDEHANVTVTDPHGRITYVNGKFCATTQYSREELIGKDHRLINSGYHPKVFFYELWATITAGRPWHGEIRNRAKDGSLYWVKVTILPSLGVDGRPCRYVAIQNDITSRKLAQEALALAEARLAELQSGPTAAPTVPLLPSRERQVLALVVQGLRNKEIAATLGLNVKTVETYRSRVMKRLDCTSPAELVRTALRLGLTRP